MRILLDETYPPALARALRERGIDAVTAGELGVAGSSDPDLLAIAAAREAVLLTENVADFARAANGVLLSGDHHAGVLVALSTRFSRWPSGIEALAKAVASVADRELRVRTVFLERCGGRNESPPRRSRVVAAGARSVRP